MPWLRLHTEIVDDPKLADFTGDEFRLWIYLIAMGRESTVPGTIGMAAAGIAWRVRRPLAEVEATIAKCEAKGMLESDTLTVRILNWDKRQYDKPSDKPQETAARQRKARDTKSNHAHVTPESRASSVQNQRRGETETEEERKKKKAEKKAPRCRCTTGPVALPATAQEELWSNYHLNFIDTWI